MLLGHNHCRFGIVLVIITIITSLFVVIVICDEGGVVAAGHTVNYQCKFHNFEDWCYPTMWSRKPVGSQSRTFFCHKHWAWTEWLFFWAGVNDYFTCDLNPGRGLYLEYKAWWQTIQKASTQDPNPAVKRSMMDMMDDSVGWVMPAHVNHRSMITFWPLKKNTSILENGPSTATTHHIPLIAAAAPYQPSPFIPWKFLVWSRNVEK